MTAGGQQYFSDKPASRRRAPALLVACGILSVCALQPSCAATVAGTATLAEQGVAPGEVLYRARCGQCHELYATHAYSDVQWRGVIGRMQPEACITDEDASIMLAWLQSAN